ncbi:hypothetical protein YSY43_09700 [Paenibacillus sp. YSY-4.3]
MNIGPLMRSLMGDTRPGEPRALELKTGQIVRGTVLSVSEDGQEAVIQVQGVKLHAALETPLRQGETTLLQVQQPSADGLAVLKPVGSNTAAPMSAASLANALSAMGLEDTAGNRELVQMMRASGLPLTKESLQTLQQLTLHKPAAVPMSEWIQAAGIALGRGLPLTGETVAGLHQAVFGPPLHELISTLDELLGNVVRSAVGNGAKVAAGNRVVPDQAQGQMATGQPSAQGGNAASGQAPAASASSTAHSAAAAGNPAGGQAAAQTAQGGQAAMLSAAAPSVEALAGKLQQVLHELRAAMSPPGGAAAAERGAASPPPQSPAGAPTAAAGSAAAHAAAAAAPAAQAHAQGEAPPGASPALTRPAPEAEPWVGRVLKLLGAEHEQQVLRAAPSSAQEAPPAAGAAQRAAAGGAEAPGGSGQAGSAPAAAPDNAAAPRGEVASGTLQASAGAATGGADRAAAAVPGAQTHGAAAASAAAQQAGALPEAAARETLKGVLLQLLAADDVPAPLQEAARQLVHQLTGQQLLLNTDRTAPFAQVTLFLPFVGADGEQTAAVHIESRRGRKGELDAANCRLWFDLQMKSLGLIMLDVQVLDKKVMLKIYTEAETTGQFLESREAEVQEALHTAGYQLVSLKSDLLPSVEPETMGANEPGSPFSYTPTTYKGVDYRV